MTVEQRLEAEEMAAEWLKKTDKLLPGSIRNQMIASTTRRGIELANSFPGGPVTRRIGT